MKRMVMIALAAGFVGIAGTRADDAAAQLNRSKTKKAIEAAEKRMAEYCSAHPIEQKKTDDGSYGPSFVVDEGNPLTGLIGVFKARFNKNIAGEVTIYNEPIKVGTEFEDQPSQVVVGTFKARKLKKLYDYSKLYDRHRMLKKKFDKQVKELRHTVKVKLPPGHHMPEKSPNHFKATLRVTAVEWDHAEMLPTLVFYTELIESKQFGLKKD